MQSDRVVGGSLEDGAVTLFAGAGADLVTLRVGAGHARTLAGGLGRGRGF